MVGQSTVTKPGRSDEVLDADQQLRITNQVRAQFDSMIPKRPTKPNRSESDSAPTSPLFDENIPVPEFEKFRSLQSQSHVIISDANTMIQDEFVETQYYQQLDSIDKQHHTTGNGFIKVRNEDRDDGYDLRLQRGYENGGHREMLFRTNPATKRLDSQPRRRSGRLCLFKAQPERE
ncbi:hypothetical protein F0562_006647 [Nyssa sinensis]|uniref:Uncharacterized protein n=1 Tax=Nyssa sinensis TaxID=561372 RepID=A0A5J5API3_9ASTE|nr:hypothetical protein F0562_006647 [Nyssa sinensis]